MYCHWMTSQMVQRAPSLVSVLFCAYLIVYSLVGPTKKLSLLLSQVYGVNEMLITSRKVRWPVKR